MLFHGMDKNGGEINGSKRSEEGRIQEASTGRSILPHISINWIIKEEVNVNTAIKREGSSLPSYSDEDL